MKANLTSISTLRATAKLDINFHSEDCSQTWHQFYHCEKYKHNIWHQFHYREDCRQTWHQFHQDEDCRPNLTSILTLRGLQSILTYIFLLGGLQLNLISISNEESCTQIWHQFRHRRLQPDLTSISKPWRIQANLTSIPSPWGLQAKLDIGNIYNSHLFKW